MAHYEHPHNTETTSEPSSLTSTPEHSRAVSPEGLGRYEPIHNPSLCSSQPKSEQDADACDIHSNPTSTGQRCHSWWRSIGIVGLLTLVGGTLIILSSLSILIVLWQGADAAIDRNEAKIPRFWKDIVFQIWTTRVITLCSAAIRTSVSLQISLLVAALAALVLETSGARFKDVPSLSIGRVQSSPISILPVFLRQSTTGLLGAFYWVILCLVVIILLASNFISTILLSDLEITQVAALPVTNNSAITYNGVTPGKSDPFEQTPMWKRKPLAHWRFAETRLGKNRFGDTGRTYRAMLPFSDEATRISLESYSGPAVVTNARALCAPLPLDDFRIVIGDRNDLGQPMEMWLQENALLGTYKYKMNTIAFASGWAITLSPSLNTSDVNPPELRELYEENQSMRLEGEQYTMRKMVVLNTTYEDFDVVASDNRSEPEKTPKSLKRLSTKSDGLWTRIYNSYGDELLAASACYHNIEKPRVYQVNMSGRAIPREPSWQGNVSESIRHQLGIGVDPQDFQKRGVLDLDIGDQADRDYPVERNDPDERLADLLDEAPTWNMQRGPLDWLAHDEHVSVFQDILQQTNDPALAIQALMTRFSQMLYYDMMNNYDSEYSITTTQATKLLIPFRWVGLGLVIALVAVHLLLLLVVCTLFIIRTKVSMLGDAWQAVAHPASTVNDLDLANNISEREVAKWSKATGRDKELYVLSGSEGNGVEIRLRKEAEIS